MGAAKIDLAELRDVAEQTLDGTLPYEESWLMCARGVVALLDAVELANCYCEPLPYKRELETAKERGDKLRAALARFDFDGPQ